jgi:hypothetical protein
MILARSCSWCGGPLVEAPGPGRPRLYCRPSHRQRAYEARREAKLRHLAPDEVVLGRRSWEALRSALIRLRVANLELAEQQARLDADTGRRIAAVASLSAAVAEMQEAVEPRAAW